VRAVNVGLLGCGVVGTGFVDLVRRSAPLVAARTGVTVNLARVAVKDRTKPRPVERELLCDAQALFADPSVSIVVELVGGIEPARSLVLAAIESGRHVVTANKALLAAHGAEILGAARRRGVRVAFEASVCGGLPVLRAITQGLVANRIDRIWGIVNGTSNFILSAMEDGATFDAALDVAKACGFAEPDPSLDIDGHDALSKLQILVALAFGFDVDPATIRVEGIRRVTKGDVDAARRRGLVLRHLVQADRLPEGLRLSVGPVLLPERHPLAWSKNEFNSLLVRGDAVGETIFTGKGAGPVATASAVLADVVDVAQAPLKGTVPFFAGAPPRVDGGPPRVDDVRGAFVVRFGAGVERDAATAAFVRHGVDVDEFDVEDDGVRAHVADCSEAAVRAAAADLGPSALVVPRAEKPPAAVGAVTSSAFSASRV
jgi:homoserine dehydrogenase